MRGLLEYVSEQTIVVIDGIALLIIMVATVEVFVAIVRTAFARQTGYALRIVWLRYARWLVSALTFQLAADIIETSVSTSWEAIGRVGAIAIIRTFLNFFLDRDVEEMRARQHESRAPSEPAP
jgi:uncharacterized membrane protein